MLDLQLCIRKTSQICSIYSKKRSKRIRFAVFVFKALQKIYFTILVSKKHLKCTQSIQKSTSNAINLSQKHSKSTFSSFPSNKGQFFGVENHNHHPKIAFQSKHPNLPVFAFALLLSVQSLTTRCNGNAFEIRNQLVNWLSHFINKQSFHIFDDEFRHYSTEFGQISKNSEFVKLKIQLKALEVQKILTVMSLL